MLHQPSSSNEEFEVISPAQDNTIISEAILTNFEMNKTIKDENGKSGREPPSKERMKEASRGSGRMSRAEEDRKAANGPIKSVSPKKK